MISKDIVHIDASTFQAPLERLAEVLAQKVRREAPKLLKTPEFVSVDLHVLIRHAIFTYNLFFYLNADERRNNDCYWRNAYSIVTLPLIRNMIDDLYNVTFILQDPAINGAWFRKSGFKKILSDLNDDEKRYSGRPEWDEWIKSGREEIYRQIQQNRLAVADVLTQKSWPTLGRYIGRKPKAGTYTPHQDFLRTFTLGKWREYSSMAHGAFEGLMRGAMYYISDILPHNERPALNEAHERILFVHISRVAILLLSIVTELQAYFHFDEDGTARINERIHEVWNTLLPVPEAKEIYDEHYVLLMKNNGIEAAPHSMGELSSHVYKKNGQ